MADHRHTCLFFSLRYFCSGFSPFFIALQTIERENRSENPAVRSIPKNEPKWVAFHSPLFQRDDRANSQNRIGLVSAVHFHRRLSAHPPRCSSSSLVFRFRWMNRTSPRSQSIVRRKRTPSPTSPFRSCPPPLRPSIRIPRFEV